MTRYKYDSDGWFAGTVESDEELEGTTDVDPEVTEGGAGKRWNGTSWVAFVNPEQPPISEQRAAAYALRVDPLICEYNRRQLMDEATEQVWAEILAVQAKIDEEFPVEG